MLPQPGSLIVSGQLNGVAALSGASVWAAGSTIVGNAVSDALERQQLDGGAHPRRGPPGSPGGVFEAVAAVSARDVWAVGVAAGESLAEHWNGAAWSRVPTPQPGGTGGSVFLYGVSAVSATDVWAVGAASDGTTVILHWNGAAWTQVPSPAPAGLSSELYGMAAVSAASAWAVGQTATTAGGTWSPLIEHWNGAAWTLVPSPAIPGGGTLAAVSASSPRNAWAVGASGEGG